MKLKSVIVADDLRHEVGNKYTVVGMYFDSIIFPAGTGPVGLPKLCVLFIIQGLRGREALRYRMWLDDGEEPSQAPELKVEAHKPETDEHLFSLQLAPAIFPAPYKILASLDVEVDGTMHTFRYQFAIVRKQPPGGN
jgi:hypothetical protein